MTSLMTISIITQPSIDFKYVQYVQVLSEQFHRKDTKVLILSGLRNTHYTMRDVEIICQNCGADTLLNRTAVYDGFEKTGERLTCSSCGYVYSSEREVPFKVRPDEPEIFTVADRSAKVNVFAEGENKRICRYCASYIINPFTQFCAVHKKEVQATDTCNRFEQAGDHEKNDSPI